jgi:fucose 4-O-acetylase-like acetyltransferase
MTATDLVATLPAAAGVDRAATEPVETAGASARLLFADHMRVALTALVVIHHLAIAIAITIPGLWYLEDSNKDPVAQTAGLFLILFNQAFFMGAFFLIAGYFTPFSYDRKGARGFLRDRVLRLLVPIVAFDLVIGPLALIPATHGNLSIAFLVEIVAGPGPLWFAEVLFLFGCAYVAVRLVRRRPASPEPAAPPTALAVVLFTVGLAVVTFAFRMIVPIGFFVPILGLPTPAYLPQYVGLFAVGIVAARRDWFRSIPDRMGWIGLAVSAAVTVALFPAALLTGLQAGSFAGGPHWQAAAYALWDSTLAVGMFLGLLVIFRRWANRAGTLWNELSRSAFGVYVMHPPLVVAVTLVLIGLPLEPLLKLLLAIAIALPLCFTVAGLARRIRGVARVL